MRALPTDEEPSGPGFTCRYTAALRHVESTCVASPVLIDPLAEKLCGPAALALAVKELEDLQSAQGPGKHLRVPARTRLLDDRIQHALQRLGRSLEPPPVHDAAAASMPPRVVQVVSLGCGMDTRPWRLPLNEAQSCVRVHWFDVDLPLVASIKAHSLEQAGAGPLAGLNAATCTGGAAGWGWSREEGGHGFPLQPARYTLTAADLAFVPLADALLPCGFDPTLLTVWCLEALVYYMPLASAAALWRAMAALCPPHSIQIVTCVDAELLEASRSRVPASHVFANLWHFDVQDMLTEPGFCSMWSVVGGKPRTTKDLALQELGADTYVALYGGAECVVVAERV